MIHKTWLIRGLLLLLLLSLTLLVYLTQREFYSPISDLHIQQLQEKENIEILDVKMNNEVDKPFAYVFYKRGVKIGACAVRVINQKLDYDMDLMLNEDDRKPVQVFGIQTGYPYLMIRIHDDQLLQDGSFIQASFNQDNWHRIKMDSSRRNYIVLGDYDEADQGRLSVQIYNKNKEVIFE
ncbi:hypothetical protein IM700_008445 [Paenibacillus sp. DXFW5]|uniref:Uncharacterized protein n=1 Tax=Paenibacillus rhizolycopersici TaxID=2780073 RepID=A0ABS2H7I5_9BACL|nr:hypothetical protein [Paenibacillus rhizolycopersici]MBM6995694.1 hypothetical protein [Paenibacillus rhizolycopersici]